MSYRLFNRGDRDRSLKDTMKSPLCINLVICLLFFTLFLLFGWQLAPIFYFRDSKLMNYAADFFGDLVLMSIDPASGTMLDADWIHTDTNPLAFSLDDLDTLVTEIREIDGVELVMPLSRFYQGGGNPVQVNNGYGDKSETQNISAFTAYDFSQLGPFFEDQRWGSHARTYHRSRRIPYENPRSTLRIIISSVRNWGYHRNY